MQQRDVHIQAKVGLLHVLPLEQYEKVSDQPVQGPGDDEQDVQAYEMHLLYGVLGNCREFWARLRGVLGV